MALFKPSAFYGVYRSHTVVFKMADDKDVDQNVQCEFNSFIGKTKEPDPEQE